ncbi:hypothetical protein NMY22_g17926 [Coprinellus aureogranulatus]|nr:hypothetical protein NMY22_g17926 [Coprinellus aureogranulatus]
MYEDRNPRTPIPSHLLQTHNLYHWETPGVYLPPRLLRLHPPSPIAIAPLPLKHPSRVTLPRLNFAKQLQLLAHIASTRPSECSNAASVLEYHHLPIILLSPTRSPPTHPRTSSWYPSPQLLLQVRRHKGENEVFVVGGGVAALTSGLLRVGCRLDVAIRRPEKIKESRETDTEGIQHTGPTSPLSKSTRRPVYSSLGTHTPLPRLSPCITSFPGEAIPLQSPSRSERFRRFSVTLPTGYRDSVGRRKGRKHTRRKSASIPSAVPKSSPRPLQIGDYSFAATPRTRTRMHGVQILHTLLELRTTLTRIPRSPAPSPLTPSHPTSSPIHLFYNPNSRHYPRTQPRLNFATNTLNRDPHPVNTVIQALQSATASPAHHVAPSQKVAVHLPPNLALRSRRTICPSYFFYPPFLGSSLHIRISSFPPIPPARSLLRGRDLHQVQPIAAGATTNDGVEAKTNDTAVNGEDVALKECGFGREPTPLSSLSSSGVDPGDNGDQGGWESEDGDGDDEAEEEDQRIPLDRPQREGSSMRADIEGEIVLGRLGSGREDIKRKREMGNEDKKLESMEDGLDSTLDGGTFGEENSDPDDDEEHQGVRAWVKKTEPSLDNGSRSGYTTTASPAEQEQQTESRHKTDEHSANRHSLRIIEQPISSVQHVEQAHGTAADTHWEDSDDYDGVDASNDSATEVSLDIETEVEDNASAAAPALQQFIHEEAPDHLVTRNVSLSIFPSIQLHRRHRSSVPETDSPSVTMTDPDAATTTAEALPASETTALAVAPLPVGIPNKILPNPQLDLSTVQDGFSLVSILFKSTLNWPFVVANEISSSQIFAYSKVLIATALQIPGDEVKTYALQVFIPSTYKSPSDAAQLGTIYLAYIPSELVEDLASQLKAKNSRFYTAVNDNVALALAQNVNSAFSVTSVVDPNGSSSGGNGGAAKTLSSASSPLWAP